MFVVNLIQQLVRYWLKALRTAQMLVFKNKPFLSAVYGSVHINCKHSTNFFNLIL